MGKRIIISERNIFNSKTVMDISFIIVYKGVVTIKSVKIISLLIASVMLLVGCNNNRNLEIDNDADMYSMENPFKGDKNTIILGSLWHRPARLNIAEKGNKLPFEYNGGEFRLDYQVAAEGTAKNVGFLVFLDGIPQPYKINDTNAPYEYMHNFRLEKDNEPLNFTFIFTPVTGKKSDLLNIEIVSIYYAEFIPDMIETTSYGTYHHALPANYLVSFNEDADWFDTSLHSINNCLSNVKISSEAITNGFLKDELSNPMLPEVTMENINSNIFTLIYLDGKMVQNNYKLHNDEPLRVKYKICGVPGADYKSTIYINHQPVSDDKTLSIETKLEKGNLWVVEAEIDPEKLGNYNTFYITFVPTNPQDYYDENVYFYKTPSILLYKGVNPNNAAITGDSVNVTLSSEEELDLSGIGGKIHNIYYAGGNNVIISAEKLYLFDLKNNRIISDTDKKIIKGEDYRVFDNGYAAIGITEADKKIVNNSNDTYTCIFYDKNLKQTKTINISDLTSNRITPANIALSNDGKYLAFSDLSGLYLYDMHADNKTMLIDFTCPDNTERCGIVHMEMIGFADECMIAFKAQSFDIPPKIGIPSFDTYGTINIDGTGLVNKKKDGYEANEISIYKDFIVVSEDFLKPTGRLMIMDIATGKEKLFTLCTQKESGSVHCSDSGGYFATAMLQDNLRVRLYSMESGELLKEKIITDDNPVYFYREPVIRIIDNIRTCLVVLGNTQSADVDTKIIKFSF